MNTTDWLGPLTPRAITRLIAHSALAIPLLVGPALAPAQSRAAGPWWPTEWGPDDQAGASNRITPAKVLEALSLVERGEIYEIGQIYENGMPLVGNRTYGLKLIPGGNASGSNRVVGNDEFLAAEVGQVGTQFDGLGHIGRELEMADGSIERVFYNGFTASEMNAGNQTFVDRGRCRLMGALRCAEHGGPGLNAADWHGDGNGDRHRHRAGAKHVGCPHGANDAQ